MALIDRAPCRFPYDLHRQANRWVALPTLREAQRDPAKWVSDATEIASSKFSTEFLNEDSSTAFQVCAMRPGFDEGAKMALQRPSARRVEPVECLIEHDELWRTDQCEKRSELLACAQRVGVDELIEQGLERKRLRQLECGGVDLTRRRRARDRKPVPRVAIGASRCGIGARRRAERMGGLSGPEG
jgi:hypothetical protein